MNIDVKKLHPDAKLPTYATPGSAGADLYSVEALTLQPGEIRPVSTGLAFAIPPEYEVQIRPRSGLASKGLTVANAPGTIDSDYRGEIKVLLVNHATTPHEVTPGDRIAQMVVAHVGPQAVLVEVQTLLVETLRGEGGFGSTGIR